MKFKRDEVSEIQYLPLGMSIGLSIGVAIGAAMDNIPVCMCIGLSIGVGIGAALDFQNKNPHKRRYNFHR